MRPTRPRKLYNSMDDPEQRCSARLAPQFPSRRLHWRRNGLITVRLSRPQELQLRNMGPGHALVRHSEIHMRKSQEKTKALNFLGQLQTSISAMEISKADLAMARRRQGTALREPYDHWKRSDRQLVTRMTTQAVQRHG